MKRFKTNKMINMERPRDETGVYRSCICSANKQVCDGWPGCQFINRKKTDPVNHPTHYGGPLNIYEAISVIEAWKLDFCLGNTIKYISRAGKKDPAKELEDLEKAAWYLNRRIEQLKGKQ